MRIRFEIAPLFPKLGYVGVVRGHNVVVRHGEMIEIVENRFSDGAWDGNFHDTPDFGDFLCGTVGWVREGALEILVSQSPVDRVFLHDDGDRCVFSNSLPLMLLELEDSLDPDVISYRSRFTAADYGLSIAPRTVRLDSGRSLRILLNERAVLSEGKIKFDRRPPDTAFSSFGEYRSRLAKTVKGVVQNAQDPRRANPLQAMPSISAGYDSSVVAVLAAEAGCTEALTLLRYTDETRSELQDYPGRVAAAVGIDLIGVERDRWRDDSDMPEAFIAAAAVTSVDTVFLTYAEHLANRLILVGFSGDNVWGVDNFRAHADIALGHGNFNGRGLAEHRLLLGYVIFVVPMIGHGAHPSILRISKDPSMAPWRIGGKYDRPIARRIVEEAGVARSDFAPRKFAGSARVGSTRHRYVGRSEAQRREELLEVMTIPGVESFLTFVGDVEGKGRGPAKTSVRLKLLLGSAGFWLLEKVDAADYRVGKALHGYGVRGVVPRRLFALAGARVRINADYTYLLPHWGVSKLVERYSATAGASR